MKPRHFWWLVETINPPQEGPHLPKDTRNELLALLAEAESKAREWQPQSATS